MECNKCGMCCRVIGLTFDVYNEETRKALDSDASYRFALNHFTPLTHEEAVKINPYLQKWLDINSEHWFYKCDMFDEETSLCKDYENRPYMCIGFPLYGKKGKLNPDEILYSEDCPYNELIEREVTNG